MDFDPKFDSIGNLKILSNEITTLIEKELKESSPVLIGINIGTLDGTLLANKFNKHSKLSKNEIAAANSSLVFLSSKLIDVNLGQKMSYNLITGKEKIILSVLTTSITMVAYLNKQLAELEGLNSYISKLKKFALRISAFVETSDLLKEEIFVAIKRAIPNTIVAAIITKDGLPIKVQSTMPDPIFSAMIAAIYKIANVLLEKSSLEFSIIGGEEGSIIIHELDENRILCIAVPESDDKKLGTYIAKIKAILS